MSLDSHPFLLLGLAAGALPFLAALAPAAETGGEATGSSPYVQWENGPPHTERFFPIAVWLQNPRHAAKYRAAGINTYVGLWAGPTDEQLAALKQAGLRAVCHQNDVGLRHLGDSTIIGWMHGDEPDNAQPLGQGRGYGPPLPPARIVEGYEEIRKTDPTRPVLLNLGQGVAWDGWHGRGERTNHPEDYPEYVKGCDIASFDIYPAAHTRREVAGKLWYVARGVERLGQWSRGAKVVWNCIECTRVKNPERKATPHQVRAEVWMSLVHGSMGIIYFVHEWQPRFNEAALLHDPPMLAAVTEINRQIANLAPVLNSPALPDSLSVSTEDPEVPVAAMLKRYGGTTYVFAVAMREAATRAVFHVAGLNAGRPVEVLGEGRSLTTADEAFEDAFGPYDVHLYRIPDTPASTPDTP